QGDLDRVLDVADADAVAGGLLAVDVNFQIALAHDRLGDYVAGALDGLEGLFDLLAHAVDVAQVGAKDLDADLRAHAGGEHVDAVGDRLRPDVAPAGHLQDGVHFLEQIALRPALPPPQEEFVGERLLQFPTECDEGFQQVPVVRFAVARPRRPLDKAAVFAAAV